MSERTIDEPVLAVLSAGRCDGLTYFLPPRQLDRKMYQAVNAVLSALGGKWNRAAKGHIFDEDCEPLIDAAIETGTYTRPQDMGWFPTPPALAERIVDMADIEPGMRVLEPSAGEGALAREACRRDAHVTAVEIDARRAAKLSGAVDAIHVDDFLTLPPDPTFSRVVMNPPFAKRADIHHVMHARKCLAPHGRLVSIMSAGVAFRDDVLARDFRAQCATIEPLPDGSFHEVGTDVRTVVVTMEAA